MRWTVYRFIAFPAEKNVAHIYLQALYLVARIHVLGVNNDNDNRD